MNLRTDLEKSYKKHKEKQILLKSKLSKIIDFLIKSYENFDSFTENSHVFFSRNLKIKE